MAKSNGTLAAKQKTMYSFFSTKPKAAKSPSSSSAASGDAKTSASPSNAKKKAPPSNTPMRKPSQNKSIAAQKQAKLLSKIMVDTRLAVHWPDDNQFYSCVIHAHRPDARAQERGEHPGHVYELIYDDGDRETVDLAKEQFKIIGGRRRVPDEERGGEGNDGAAANKKRRRIMEESEEDEIMESSSEEEADDSGSEYKAAGVDSADDESLDAEEESAKGVSEDDWLDSAGEEDAPKKRKVVKKVKVTRVGGPKGKSTPHVSPTPMKPSNGNAAKAKMPEKVDFSNFNAFGAAASRKPRVSLSPMPHKPATAPAQKSPPSQPRADIPKPIPGTVNPAGSHMHNHLKFFTTNRKDLKGRPTSHPDYDHRTLYVDYNELAHNSDNGKAVTNAKKQWWELKSQYADVVLLFRQGKFYEMFHDDADVGVSVLGHSYMKGIEAHSGFPEKSYGYIVGKLVDAGYKVGRVEQTETPAMLAERKKATPKGKKKPQVMSREVCSIMSRGTRTFCYLEDTSLLERGEASTGPLVAIKENLASKDGRKGGDSMEIDGMEDAGTEVVFEYGVTIVDAITGVVTLGQFDDDVLRSRLQTLLATFGPSEVLYEGGQNGSSKTLLPFLRSTCPAGTIFEDVKPSERFPKSTAVDSGVRKTLERGGNAGVKPWDPKETLQELHRRGYYPRSSRKKFDENADPTEAIRRWPEILRTCVEGKAILAISSFGAALYYLQRSLIDADILSLGIVKPYAPPNTSMEMTSSTGADASSSPANKLRDMYTEESRTMEGLDLMEEQQKQPGVVNLGTSTMDLSAGYAAEASCDHLALDGRTLSNLEILHSMSSGSDQGSLLSKIDATQSPHGSRLLRAWLLRPMFIKAEIDRRADAVEELAGGSAAVAMAEARVLLKKTGDIERLLSRVHSMGGGGRRGGKEADDGARQAAAAHPDERAIHYEGDMHTRRKVNDFSKLLYGLRAAAEIPDLFENADIRSPMLAKMVRYTSDDGCFPSDMREKLDWFFDNFDLEAAAKGQFEPARGMDEEYDAACDAIEDTKRELEAYKEEMCSNGELSPRQTARSTWKYVNTKEDSKEKYLIMLPVSVSVPDDFQVKGKRGKGAKQENKYSTPVVEELVQRLEEAIDVKNEGKAAGMKLVFARFDSMRSTWMAVAHVTAMLDALGSMAEVAVRPGFSRPLIMDCPPSAKPGVEIVQGRHPCVDLTHSGSDFIPNDLILGGNFQSEDNTRNVGDGAGVLLLSGPNMGGKSTLLRQTCLITILAQMGSYVPAERCALTPVDRIFTRLGASDRILCGQSTFFVELAETAAAVRGATRRSLVIMDELGRGTSTFDGTAIASATVKHLVERNGCLTLFATHYHSLLEDWKNEPTIKLGHMECIVEDDEEDGSERRNNITFLYTLGDGPCPKSFGVNVARLAGLPDDVLQRAKRVSSLFEAEMNGEAKRRKIIPSTAEKSVDGIFKLLGNAVDSDGVKRIWASLQ